MLFVDVETSGLDPEDHSILSIGALDFYHPDNQFYEECRIEPGAEVSEYALEINGFTEEEIYDQEKPSVAEVVEAFIDWSWSVEDRTPFGQNTEFDMDFIETAANKYGIECEFGHRPDTLHTACRMHMDGRGLNLPLKEDTRTSDLSLDRILNYVGLPDEPEPHNALTGAKMEAEAYSRLSRGEPLLREYEKFPVPRELP